MLNDLSNKDDRQGKEIDRLQHILSEIRSEKVCDVKIYPYLQHIVICGWHLMNPVDTILSLQCILSEMSE